MRAYFRERDIRKYVSQSDDCKASVAEKAIQTVKRRLYRYLSHNATLRWIEALPQIVDAINRTRCRVTGMAPSDMTPSNWHIVWQRLYGDSYKHARADERYRPDTTVRIDMAKGAFAKGYLPNFSQEIFRIRKVRPGNPTTYELEDQKGELILGKFFAENFSKAKPAVRRIAHVWETRTRRRHIEYCVSWTDGNPRDREWITEAQLI